jgi:hypothetical protein
VSDIERREFRPCEKCGEINPKVSYRRSNSGLACRSSCDRLGEHFHLQCSRCDYLWMVAIEETP